MIKRIFMIIFLFLLVSKTYSQTDHWFEANIYRINEGYDIPYTVFDEDSMNVTLVTDTINPKYESPYTSFLWRIDTVRAIPQYPWTDNYFWLDSFNLKIPIDYPRGIYEITFTHTVYLDSFWTMIDTNHVMILDSTTHSYSTNAAYIGVDTSDITLIVELNFFEVVLVNGDAIITWITESELNNCMYNLLRKEHGKNEKLIATFNGQGNTSSRTTYGYVDREVLQGKTYTYILKSISCDGKIKIEGRFAIFIPIEYGLKLYQNYPNPANPITTIKFRIDEPSYVKLFLYDIRGGKTATIIDKKMDNGDHEANINCSKIASGTYFYVLKAHNLRTNSIKILSKKMVVIK